MKGKFGYQYIPIIITLNQKQIVKTKILVYFSPRIFSAYLLNQGKDYHRIFGKILWTRLVCVKFLNILSGSKSVMQKVSLSINVIRNAFYLNMFASYRGIRLALYFGSSQLTPFLGIKCI